jgi:hypothetical protein
MPKKEIAEAPAPGLPKQKQRAKAKAQVKAQVIQEIISPAPGKKEKRKTANSQPPIHLAIGDGTATVGIETFTPVRKGRVHIGDAMRSSGLDEYKVGAMFASVVEKLSGTKRGDGGVQKLFVDVLKECSRHLDPPHSAERDARESSGSITLIHCVPRPDRSVKEKPELAAEPAVTALEVKPQTEEKP